MVEIKNFKKAYSKAIQNGYAAIFAGAGLSKASGFVDWNELLDDLAKEIKLDVKKVYFSPRLATERKRLAKQVKDGEIILDMFAGIGPFPILIAKEHEVDIYATDINKEAIKYMENNIEINKLKGKIRPILGDVNKIAEEKFIKENIRFDRIIMNLPGTAKDFLELAMTLVNNEGIIHYYEFSDGYESAIKRIEKIAKKQNKNFKILNTRKVKSSSPKEWHIVVDAQIQ